MNTASWVVCKSFLDKCPAQKKQSLLQYISSSSREEIRSLAKPAQDPSTMSDDPADILQYIHPSWFSSFLRAYTESEIALFLSALPHNLAEGLRKELFFTKPAIKLSLCSQKFLQHLLLDTLFEFSHRPIPKELLPEHPLSVLLTLSPEEIQTVIHLLAMQDLSIEMKLIIDNAKIKSIQNTLTPVEKAYLRSLPTPKQTLSFGKPFLQQWNGNESDLRKELVQRGTNRFAKACYGLNPDFYWYLHRSLEIDKASLFTKFCVKQQNPQIVEILIAQIIDIVSYLKNSKTSGTI